jgi:hypothetical protein
MKSHSLTLYRISDGDNIPAVAIENKAPHKLSGDELVTGLDTEIQPECDVIHKEGDGFIFAAKSLSAVVINLTLFLLNRHLKIGIIKRTQIWILGMFNIY